jgi:hypothetical protein
MCVCFKYYYVLCKSTVQVLHLKLVGYQDSFAFVDLREKEGHQGHQVDHGICSKKVIWRIDLQAHLVSFMHYWVHVVLFILDDFSKLCPGYGVALLAVNENCS